MRCAVCVALIVAASVVAGCGGDSSRPEPAQQVADAIQDQARGMRDRNTKVVCSKTFLSTDLPRRLASGLHATSGGSGSPSNWDRHYRECLEQFGRNEEFDGGGPEITIHEVRLGGPSDPAAGITTSASARVTVQERGRRYDWTTRVVRFRGDWKVIFNVR